MKRRVLSFVVTLALCLNLCPMWVLAAGGETGGGLCSHHPEHTDGCRYVPENPDAPCTFVCLVCPIEDLIASLPRSISEQNSEQVRAQIDEIYERYDGLTEEEQQQVDLSPCAALLDQTDGLGSEVLDDGSVMEEYTLNGDKSFDSVYPVVSGWIINTNGYTLTGLYSTVIQVTETGILDLRGNIVAKKGAGVEVMKGGVLMITEPGTNIKGFMYALDIASGAEVSLSTGTYYGKSAAIRTEDGDFAALLAEGCAYFDANGTPILPADVADFNEVMVGPCTEHADKVYVHNPGSTEHTWTCQACGTEETAEKCTFNDFESDGNETYHCDALCGNKMTIAIDQEKLKKLVYDGTVQSAKDAVTVTVKDASSPLELNTDYSVSYSTKANVGSSSFTVKVTVEGKAYDGTPFTQEYTFDKDPLTPPVQWSKTSASLPYTGSEVTKDQLPDVTINITSTAVNLKDQLQYSYRVQGDAAYTDGLPTNAGIYEVVVSLPGGPDFPAFSSEPLTLTITKIRPILTAPAAKNPVFNRTAQELVTGGTLHPAAARDGVEIKFATSENGTYSTAIPTGIDAGTYTVWYRTDATDNYEATPPTKVTGVIQRKPITPVVTLSDYTYLYDGGYKEPTVTVKDKDHVTVLLDTEYAVAYQNNRDVGTAKVVVTDRPNGNYAITRVEVDFEITSRTQEALSITQKPNTITYGDKFTLGTSGGSGNGDVTWEITSGTDVATVDEKSGQVTIIGDGDATVKATKSGEDPDSVPPAGNYETSTASWPFTAEKKPVTATVTAEDKSYDGNTNAVVHAVVEQGVLPGDVISITGLTGTFKDENAGVDKIVDVDISSKNVGGKNFEHYIISYSSATTAVKATIHKATASITAPITPTNLTYNAAAQALIDTGAVVNPSTVLAEYALSEAGPYSTDFPKGTNAGTYTVWYRVQDTNNYTGQSPAPAPIDVTVAKKPVTPTITLSGDGLTAEPDGTYSYTYNGHEKRPDVTLTETDGTSIPNTEYTATYSNNINVSSKAAVTVKEKADGNYSFTSVTQNFTIQQKEVTPVILLEKSPSYSTPYTGSPITPAVTVVVDGEELPTRDCKAEYSNNIDVGTATVRVKSTGGNYKFDATVTFKITPVGQNPLTIFTDKPTNVYYGETIHLSAVGGSGNGTIQWSIDDANVAGLAPDSGNNCVVTVTGTGWFSVKAQRPADGGYSEPSEDIVAFYANPKPVTPVVTAANKPYDGTPGATLNAEWKSGDLVGSDTIDLTVTGQFLTADVGIDKQVKVISHSATGANVNKYEITWPQSTTASIEKVDAELSSNPEAASGLIYNGSPHPLVTGGATKNGIGTLEYKLDGENEYSSAIPTGTAAGTYTVWYRVEGNENYTGIAAASVEVTIAKATPIITWPTASGTSGQRLSEISLTGGTASVLDENGLDKNLLGEFTWKDDSITPVNGDRYDVIFTPADTTNYKTVTSQIEVTVTGGSGDTSGSGGTGGGSDTSGSGSTSGGASTDGTGSTYSQPKADIQNGTASTVVSAADGGKLVEEAIANQSQAIVIKPEIASDVTKTEVAIPASTVSRIKSETNAALTVSSPIADVTIPHAALDTLSRSGEAVNVVTEQVGQSVVLTLTSGGETLKDIPGGVTLTVPAADAGPGTVAVLLHDDGTSEILRKSIAGDGKVSIPLNGSAVVEIVDNSKDFADVPPASWAADAVAFASAHELFNGTSETTFSPDQAMSRGMLATVLYNLEGRPDQALTSEFSDVGSETWYADSIAWAAENGITNGYGDGQFGPNDSITREQFVVMLWKYAGSPEAREQNLAFTDADQASGYAQKALCWAVENGILSGYANGQLAPGGTATRAQAAQMLKNFMENS